MKRRTLIVTIAALGVTLLLPRPAAHAQDTRKQTLTSINRGIEYLKSTQEEDGSWGKYPAVTALAVTALLKNGRTEAKEPAVAKGVQYILHAAKPNGAIYNDADPALAMPNYNTALCLMALANVRNPAYLPVIRKAQKYLEESQFGGGDGKSENDPMYGGIGYGSKPDRPDLSNLQMALEALKESSIHSGSAVWTKAVVFLQRVQNLKESNDQEWAKTASGDGGFIYDSKGRSFSESGGLPQSYGSMTYAGLKSLPLRRSRQERPTRQSRMGLDSRQLLRNRTSRYGRQIALLLLPHHGKDLPRLRCKHHRRAERCKTRLV